MLPTDVFCRAAVYPKCTRNGNLDPGALLKFSSLGVAVKALSLVSWDKCCSEELVHDFGLGVAEEQNRRASETHGAELPEEQVHHYLGYYSFNARFFRADFLIHSSGIIRHAPEDGDDRHFHVELHAKEEILGLSNSARDRKFSSDERIARDKLAEILFGPTPLPDGQCCERQLDLKKVALRPCPLTSL